MSQVRGAQYTYTQMHILEGLRRTNLEHPDLASTSLHRSNIAPTQRSALLVSSPLAGGWVLAVGCAGGLWRSTLTYQ